MIFKVVKAVDDGADKFSLALLVACVFAMLGMSVGNIVLRWFDAHVLWFEPAVRYLVLLATFLGGSLATGMRTHIGIDLIGKYFESKHMEEAHRWVGRVIALVSFIVLIFLIKACLGFVDQEAQYGRDNVFIGLHAKHLATVLPFGFTLIAFRFFNSFVLSFSKEYRPAFKGGAK